MSRYFCPLMFTLAACMLWAPSASAAVYYVDFHAGDNGANGQSPQSAWKHAPGDSNATGAPAEVALAAGDTVIFKGGVAYHGSIRLTASGTADQPITLDGNTAGTFGEGRAIIDGGQVITDWQQVASAEQVGGNPRWRDIFHADIDLDITSNVSQDGFVGHRKAPRNSQAPWQRVILTDGDQGLLPIAQRPKPKDHFYPDLPRDFFRTPQPIGMGDGESIITDPDNLIGDDPDQFEGMLVGVHGGNNHVYFAPVKRYDPETHRLFVPQFKPKTYDQTRYALYNSVRLIEQPGEWAIRPLGDGRSRIYLLPDPSRMQGGQPADIGYPVFESGIQLRSGASHWQLKGLLIQRFSGGSGGISVGRNDPRSRGIHITDCEIRFVAGHAGIGVNYSDDIVIENCHIHHCPGWTTAMFLNRVKRYAVRNNHLVKNSGSGIRHYECKEGLLQDNAILDHYGMHSSAINVYEGCADVVLERNYIQNTATINRNAENIIFRNNVIDGQGRSMIALAIWSSGRVGGRDVRDIQFLNNTFVNMRESSWGGGIFVQSGASAPQGLVIRDNILDRLDGAVRGEIANNIYLRESKPMGEGSQVVTDANALFIDPANGDFRRRPGGPAMDVGADIPPPTARAAVAP